MKRYLTFVVASALWLGADISANAQPAYFSLIGDFPAAGDQHDFYFDLTRPVSSGEVLRFETFANGGGTNTAGDNIPPGGIDSVLELFDSGGNSRGHDDDGSFTTGADSLLSWPGIGQINSPPQHTPLNPDPLPAGGYLLRLLEFGNNDPGQWALDLVGPADAITLTDQSPIGTSTINSLRVGNGARVSFSGNYELDGEKFFQFLSGADFTVTGYLDIGNTGGGQLLLGGAGTTLTTSTANTTFLDWGQGGNTAFIYLFDGATAEVGATHINLATDTNPNTSAVLDVAGGSVFTANTLYVGTGNGGGTVVVTGDGSTIAQNGAAMLSIGDMVVSSGKLSDSLGIGDHAVFNSGSGAITVSSNGQVIVNNGTFNANGTLTVASTGGIDNTNGVLVRNQGRVNSVDVSVGTSTADGSVLINGFTPGFGLRATWQVTGSMTIGSAGLGSGSAMVEQAGLLDVANNLTVAGSMDATGTLTVQTNGQVTVGNQLTVGNNGTVNLLGSQITAGSFIVQSGGTFTHEDGTLTVVGGTFDPGTGTSDYVITGATSSDRPKVVLTSGANAALAGGLIVGQDNYGELTIENGASLVATASVATSAAPTAPATSKVTVQGLGSQLVVFAPPMGEAILGIGGTSPGELIISAGGQVRVQGGFSLGCCGLGGGSGSGQIIVEGQDSLLEAGNFSFRAVGDDSRVTIRDHGVVHATGTVSNGYNRIWPASNFAPTDIEVEVTDIGSMLQVDGYLLDISGSDMGTGSTARLTIRNGGVAHIAGDVHLVGLEPGATYVSVDGDTAGTASFEVGGALSVGGYETSAIEGTAKVTIANDGQVVAGSAKVWSPGSVELDGAVISTSTLELAGGTLQGNGVVLVSGALANAGVVSPGVSPGVITVSGGNYEQATSGRLAIEIGGQFSSQYDRLDIVSGTATLAGTLDVSLIDLGSGVFAPSAGQTFDILTAAGGLGGTTFTTELLPALSGGLFFDVIYNSTAVTLAVSGILGDYNQNGTVDAADYVMWRNNLGSPTALPNDDTPGVGQDDYTRWRAHFGQTAGSGTGAIESATVPEPASVLALLLGAAFGIHHWQRVARRMPTTC